MGLDMFIYKAAAPPKNGEKIGGYTYWEDNQESGPIEKWQYGYEGDPNHPQARVIEEIHYWRKHPNMHGIMEQIYIENDGEKHEDHQRGTLPGYNAITMELTLEDIERIETHVLNNTLPFTEGFFFGKSYLTEVDDDNWEEYNKEVKERDLEFIKKAKEALDKGFHLFYYPCW